MGYDVDVLIQNIRTLCAKQNISLAQFWSEVFGVQKNFTNFRHYPPKMDDIQKMANYFHVSPLTLTHTVIDPPMRINGETVVENFKKLCDEHNLTMRAASQNIFGLRKNFSQWRWTAPPIDTVQQIADYFHIPIEDLIGQSLETPISRSEPQDKPVQTEEQNGLEAPDLKILFRNASNLTDDNLKMLNDMVSFLLDKQKKQNNDH